MKILAIETSCDDTAVAIVKFARNKTEILSNIVSSQTEIHKEWGGVHPALAKREHDKNLPLVFEKALNNFKADAIAVTVGPGLDPCLWSGIGFAKKIAQEMNLPIIPANHIEAHILINLLGKKTKFPAIALIVSGGHTQLILMTKIGRYKIIGETKDDAVGECFDKTARILGLGYPGGPAIAVMAARISNLETRISKQNSFKIQNSKFKIHLPRPMINTKDYDFSFSGLKTAVLYDFKKRSGKERESEGYKVEMAKEIQQAAIDILIKKTLSAINDFGAKALILGGGVSANEELRNQFKKRVREKEYEIDFLIPPKNLSTDNAAMIAVAGYYNKKKATRNYDGISARPNLRIG